MNDKDDFQQRETHDLTGLRSDSSEKLRSSTSEIKGEYKQAHGRTHSQAGPKTAVESQVEKMLKKVKAAVKKKNQQGITQSKEREVAEIGLGIKKGRFTILSLAQLQEGLSVSAFSDIFAIALQFVHGPPEPGQKKKRSYKKKTKHKQINKITPQLKRLEDLTRLTSLCTLDPETCALLVSQLL
jgi:hypothetical protein